MEEGTVLFEVSFFPRLPKFALLKAFGSRFYWAFTLEAGTTLRNWNTPM